jgi:hypothetical protein
MAKIFGKNGKFLLDKDVGKNYLKPLRHSRPVKPVGAKERARAERRKAQDGG